MSATSFRDRPRKRRVNLSVTPLIDVLFLLIIFFSITGTFKRAGELELALPEASTSTPSRVDAESNPVEIVVTEAGDLTLDGESFTFEDVARALRDVVTGDATRGVVIKAESGVPHGDVVRLLDIVRDVGFPGVSIGTYVAPSNPPLRDRAAE